MINHLLNSKNFDLNLVRDIVSRGPLLPSLSPSHFRRIYSPENSTVFSHCFCVSFPRD
jgi:hypothetical protein